MSLTPFTLKCLAIFAFLSALDITVNCERTNQKIYTYLKADYPCFRRLNATHQVGCASSRRGDVGVVYYVANVTDFDWVLEHGPFAPYVIVLQPAYFNKKNLTKMKLSGKVSGVLVVSPSLTSFPAAFSPDQSCPNQQYGMYTNTTGYDGCSVNWNNMGDGTFYEDWTFPIFLIENADDWNQLVEHCYQKFNAPIHGVPREWPLCAAQLYSSMYAAKDSKTCIRRSQMITNLNPVRFCDPLGDYNVWSTLKATNKSEPVANDSLIVLAARLDSFSMFDNIGPGGESAVSGLVTLLAVVDALSKLSNESFGTDKNVLFVVFNGEAFDYLGSNRMVYDMQKNVFPLPLSTDYPTQPPLITLDSIGHFIELNQLGIQPLVPSIFIHTDPVSTRSPSVNQTVNDMLDILTEEAQSGPVEVKRAPSTHTLPPASLQSFLRAKIGIPGIVITDHETQYSNLYYNSMYDGRQIEPSSVSYIENTSTLVARLIHKLLTGKESSLIAPTPNLVSELLDCYMNLKDCRLFNETSPALPNKMRKNPSFYVGVDGNANIMRIFTAQLMSHLMGEQMENTTQEQCTPPSDDAVFSYRWMVGNYSGYCVKSTVNYSPARSPAFDITDYDMDSGVYPVWTESVWNNFSLRVFLKPSLQQEIVTLCLGLLVLILSFSFVWFLNQNSSLLFSSIMPEVATTAVAC